LNHNCTGKYDFKTEPSIHCMSYEPSESQSANNHYLTQ